jgi:hypothetical protein
VKSENSPEKKIKVLHTIDVELKEWLEAEKKRTGTTVGFIIEKAVRQYRDRLERGRKND